MEKSKCCTNSQKNDKQCFKSYRLVSPFPICSKVLERVIYNTMFTYLKEKNLSSENQSWFKPSFNQLLALTHEIFPSFDGNYKVTVVFLDVSKAFNKLWREGIIHKLKRSRISRNLLNLSRKIFRNRKQRIILNDLKVHVGPVSMLVFFKILY